MRVRHALFSIISLAGILQLSLYAQIRPSNGKQILKSLEQYQEMRENSLLKHYPATCIGPSAQGGRVTAIAVHPDTSKTFYVGFASGGVFRTDNNGISFYPVFDNQGALGVSDIVISPSNPNVIWVATGENNSSRSSYAGCGLYYSADGGKTWQHRGLQNSHHIGKIAIHPTNPETLWVASLGGLYSDYGAKGIYKTVNSGKSWIRVLETEEETGFIDIKINPKDPEQLWAASWERSRSAWNFDEDGPGSAIYMTEDGGLHWDKTSRGLPEGDYLGRIGIAVSPSNPRTLYAVIDNQESKPDKKDKDETKLTFQELVGMSVEGFMRIENERLNDFLKSNGFPKKYTAETVREGIKNGDYTTDDIANYKGDANKALFNTDVIGSQVYKSDNGGKSWRLVNQFRLEDVYYTYGYYFGQVRVSPDNSDEIYIGGVPLLTSKNGGRSFTRLDTGHIHVDHHALWIDPKDGDRMILGNDGGIYETYDRGAHWRHLNTLPVGQFYTVAVDQESPYNVYGGLQDNGTWKGPSNHPGKKWKRVGDGDGMFVIPDPDTPGSIFTGYQFGYYYYGTENGEKELITPKHNIGEPKLRFNWRTPLVMSPHNSGVLYLGSQYLHRSLDKGKTWEKISEDLTQDFKPQQNVPYSTITSISESMLKFGLIWVGTDDGNVQVTADGGATWNIRKEGLPEGRWVSNIYPSPHDVETAFLSLNGYRFDEFRTYLYKTTDLGVTWTVIKGNLPEDVVNVVIQDNENPDILYVGMDHGTFVSLDGGEVWHLLSSIPNVACYDMVIQKEAHDLVIATHGRSIYKTDLSNLRKLTSEKLEQMLVVLPIEKIKYDKTWGEERFPFGPKKIPTIKVPFYVNEALSEEEIKVKVINEEGKILTSMELPPRSGLSYYTWDLRTEKDDKFLEQGEYKVVFFVGSNSDECSLIIE